MKNRLGKKFMIETYLAPYLLNGKKWLKENYEECCHYEPKRCGNRNKQYRYWLDYMIKRKYK